MSDETIDREWTTEEAVRCEPARFDRAVVIWKPHYDALLAAAKATLPAPPESKPTLRELADLVRNAANLCPGTKEELSNLREAAAVLRACEEFREDYAQAQITEEFAQAAEKLYRKLP